MCKIVMSVSEGCQRIMAGSVASAVSRNRGLGTVLPRSREYAYSGVKGKVRDLAV